jgi:FtsK/SpoIIIE family
VPELKRLFGPPGTAVGGTELTGGCSDAPEQSQVRRTVLELMDEDNGSGSPGKPTERHADRVEPEVREYVDQAREMETSEGPKKLGEEAIANVSDDEPFEEVIRQLETACRLRGFKVEALESTLVNVGPTLVSIPVVLEPGESIKPIEKALPDIARELGVSSLVVENDPRPYHIRFLMPRRNRVHPKLPKDALQALDGTRGQYLGVLLGQTIDGKDYRSFVSEWPHLLIAGTTGSGKTTLMKSLLSQLGQAPANIVKCVIIDGKAELDYVGVLPDKNFHEKYPDILLGHENITEY